MPWPTVPVVTTGMDADTDSLPRADILDHANKFNQLIAMRGVASGVCDLDASALIPVSRLPAAYQPSDATLTALAGLATGADKFPYSTGTDTFAQGTVTAFARTVLDDPDQATARATLGAARVYTSAEQAITSAGTLTIAHGLGAVPVVVSTYLVCQVAEAGYSIGDKLLMNGATGVSLTTERGHSIVFDATNFVVRFSDAATCYSIIHKTTGAMAATTNANWKLVITAVL